MYQIKVENCNNIKEGIINIAPNKLNIKYGINGTGKTSLAKAIQFANNSDELLKLQSYFSDELSKVTITPVFNKILVFNEDFVNQVVFVEYEVIENSFEVFLKTPDYDVKKLQLDSHLQTLKNVLQNDSEIIKLQNDLAKLNQKFKRTSKGKLSTTGAMKSLLSKQNLYNIPSELDAYRPFLDNTDINISWIDWKNKGEAFDIEDNCPYCSEKFDIPKHTKQKQVFKNTYKKADSQNLKEVLELLQELEPYLNDDKFVELMKYIKTDTATDVITAIIEKLTTEFDLLIARFQLINEFGNRKIAIADISNLEQQINSMEFPKSLFEMFGGTKIDDIFDRINDKVYELKTEVAKLKREMGELKGLVQATVKASQNDINEFLKTAGINYELEIQVEDESNSKTVLRQCFSKQKTEVKNIRQHLSWGEKNAFSLILFMYYSQMQDADLIILDDPISSFDSNKKYAILHRMFKNVGKKDVSLVGKTVLLLTHDFEPITDFIVVGKLPNEQVAASFIWNEGGKVVEQGIDVKNDVLLIVEECSKISKMENINIVSRIAFLRKLCELNGRSGAWGEAYEILSCLIHSSSIQRKVGNDTFVEMTPDEISSGIGKIKEFINNFDYEYLKNNVYTIDGIKGLYNSENNTYLKVQLFRAICEIAEGDIIRFKPIDEGWYKFIDETYHIENDYLHYLNILKFNIVPDYIVRKVEEMMLNI